MTEHISYELVSFTMYPVVYAGLLAFALYFLLKKKKPKEVPKIRGEHQWGGYDDQNHYNYETINTTFRNDSSHVGSRSTSYSDEEDNTPVKNLRLIQVHNGNVDQITARVEDKFVKCQTRAAAEQLAREMGGESEITFMLCVSLYAISTGGLVPQKHGPHRPGDYWHYHVGNHQYIMQDNGVLANYHFIYGQQIWNDYC